ncbi:MAG: M56 family metallopeptidase [Pirellula sp.]
MNSISFTKITGMSVLGAGVTGTLWALMIDASIKSSLLLILVALASLFFARTTAAFRHWLWVSAMIGAILMPFCCFALPEWRVLPSWIGFDNSERPKGVSAFSEAKDSATHSPLAGKSSNEAFFPVEKTESDSQIAKARLLSQLPSPESSAQQSRNGVLSFRIHEAWWIGTWATGCLLCLAPIPISMIRLRRIERECGMDGMDDSGSIELRRRISVFAGGFGMQDPIVLIGPADAMPMVWSFVRPRLFLPIDAIQWSEARLESVVVHELSHVRRKDPMWLVIALVARAIHWFNPMAWYAVSRLKFECEVACDDDVLTFGIDASEYANCLLSLSTVMTRNRPGRAGALAMAMGSRTRSIVERRLESILNHRQNRVRMSCTWSIGIALIACIGSVLLSAISIFAATEQLGHPEGNEPRSTSTQIGPLDTARNSDRIVKNHDEPETANEFHDLSLEECIAIALANTRLVRLAPVQNSTENPDASSRARRPLTRTRASQSMQPSKALSLTNPDMDPSLCEERCQNLIRDVEFAYWDLYDAYYAKDARRATLEEVNWAGQLVEKNTSLHDPRAHAIVESLRSAVELAENGTPGQPSLDDRESSLRLLMGWNVPESRKLILTSDTPNSEKFELDAESVLSITKDHNIHVRLQHKVVQDRVLELVSYAARAEREGTQVKLPYAISERVSIEMKRIPVHQTGVKQILTDHHRSFRSWSRPIPLTELVDNKRMDVERGLRLLDAKRESVTFKVGSVLRQIESLSQQFRQVSESNLANQEIVELARFKLEKERIINGESAIQNLAFFARAIQSKDRSQRTMRSVLASYAKSLAELHAVQGTLFDYNNLAFASDLGH